MEIEELKQDLIDRYNMSWEYAHLTDELGVIQLAKDNFRELVDKFENLVWDKGYESGKL
jgi:hypothetical protein